MRTRVIRQERVARHLLVAFAEARLVEAHARGEQAEYLGIGLGLAQRRNGGVVGQRVKVPVGGMDIHVLELGRRRKHDVGVVRGVGQENVVHDAEKVLTREARDDLGRFRRDGDRIRVVDK